MNFVFANKGKPFSKEGVESLMTPNVSAKLKDSTTIGSKGLGFRSLLSWAKSIQIISTDLSIEFSRESAVSYLNEIYKANPAVQEQHQATTFDEYPIATLAAPSWIEVDAEKFREYTTYIIVKYDNDAVYKSILEQLHKIEAGELIFLRKLQHITVDSPSLKKTITKEGTGQDLKVSINAVQLSKVLHHCFE